MPFFVCLDARRYDEVVLDLEQPPSDISEQIHQSETILSTKRSTKKDRNSTIMGRYISRLSAEFHKLFVMGSYASRSFPDFIRDMLDAENIVLDRALLQSSPIPKARPALLEKLRATEVTLPPRAFLEDGTQSIEGLYFLASLAKALHVKRTFEIGTFTGVTALTLAINVPDMEVYTLDLPAGDPPSLKVERDDKTFIPMQRRRRVYEDRAEEARIVQLEGDSASFDFSALGETFDLVYIDGAHSYDYVANDTVAAFRIVNNSGAIVWDDYLQGWRGLVQYLNERTDLELLLVPDTRLVLWLSDEAKSRLART